MNFKLFKDRVWHGYSACARTVAAGPPAVGRSVFLGVGQLMWLVYAAPSSRVRKTLADLSAVSGGRAPRSIFRRFVRGFALGLYRMERLRLGHVDEIDSLLVMPERERLEALRDRGGVILMMPHTNASLPMVRALACAFPVLMLVRTTRDPARAASQHSYYAAMGCEILDVRRASDASVAREVMRALREGRIVVGTGDLVQKAPPPEAPVDREKDLVRVDAFGQPAGAAGWPARFALKTGAALLPVMVEEGGSRIVLHLGAVAGGRDVASVTQDWFGGLVALAARHPADWAFVHDRRWSALLDAAARSRGQRG